MTETLPAPRAERREHVEVRRGERVDDPYFWLRQRDDPAVRAYLEAENAYTAAVTAPLRPLEEDIYQEMLGRIQQTDLSVPVRRGAYWYYSRTVEGLQYEIHCRRLGAEGPEQILLDLNAMAAGRSFFSLGATALSDDARWLAYTTDDSGMRRYSLHLKDLDTGAVQTGLAERVTSVEWAADNRTLLYTTEDAVTKRSDRLWRWRPGAGAAVEVFFERDELYSLGVGRTHDLQYLLLESGATDSTEVRYWPAAEPEAEPRVLRPRQRDHKYDLDHRDGRFYVRTDLGAKNYRLITLAAADPDWSQAQEIIAHRDTVLLQEVNLFRDFAAVVEKVEGLNHIRIHRFADQSWRAIPFPEPVYAASTGANPEFDSTRLRYHYQSLVTPASVYEFEMGEGTATLLKRQAVLGGYDPGEYVSERLWATGRDGARVPMSVVYKKRAERLNRGPLLLYGYGSYGAPTSATFSIARLSLLDRGLTYVMAHVRGGNEMGEAWHDDGMLMKKKNTFFDFIDCAEALVAAGWSTSAQLGISGGSAGGLLIGAVLNLRPELFGAAHLAVPFVDVMNTMLDATLPLTTGEYLEWGDPNQAEAYAYMRSYSPYDNLAARDYPPMLVTTSLNDSQVMYWEPAKYVAKLRRLYDEAGRGEAAQRRLLLKTNLGAGHGGASGRYDRLREVAFEYAWMLSRLRVRG